MKKILFIICLFIGGASYGQPGYTTINSRYSWLAGKFTGLHIPTYATTPSLNTGQYTGSGAVGLDSVTGRFFVYIQGSWRRQLHILDTASLLATQYYVSQQIGATVLANNGLVKAANGYIGLDSNGVNPLTRQVYIDGGTNVVDIYQSAEDFGFDVIKNFDVTGTGDSSYSSFNTGFQLGYQQSTDADYAITKTRATVSLAVISTDRTVTFPIMADDKNGYILLIHNINSTANTWNTAGPVVEADNTAITSIDNQTLSWYKWDGVSTSATYKKWVKVTAGGGTPTLQQVLDAGSTLTSTETVTLGTNILIASGSSTTGSFIGQNTSSGYGIRGTSSSGSGVFATTISGIGLEVQGGTGLSGVFTQIPASANTVTPSLDLYRASTSIPSDGIGQSIRFLNAADDEISYFANSFISKFTTAAVASRTSQVDIQGVDNASTETFMNIQKDLVRINNNADTLATKAYARSVGGGTTVSFGTDNQIPIMNAGGTNFEYDADFTFDGDILLLKTTGGSTVPSIASISDQNTGINFQGSDLVGFIINGNQRVLIQYNGGEVRTTSAGEFAFSSNATSASGAGSNAGLGYIGAAHLKITNGFGNAGYGDLTLNSPIVRDDLLMADITAPSTPASGYGSHYWNTDQPWVKDDGGGVHRYIRKQGADVASVAGAIAVGNDGSIFELTGTNAVTLISNVNFANGATITLIFTSTASLTDGVANSGTDIGFELAGNANFTGSADDVITLVLSEIGGVQRWREVSRTVN